LRRQGVLYPTLSKTKKQALAPFFGELSWSFIQAIEEQLDRGNNEKAAALAESARAIIEGTPSRDDFKSLLQELFAPKAANKGLAPLGPSTIAPASEAQVPRAHQAEVLLRDHADELGMAENQLEQEFLKAVRGGFGCRLQAKREAKESVAEAHSVGGPRTLQNDPETTGVCH
jgi:hypothetical protein